jgi:predicted  nucleic acid-binding Zn-ribbon protein
MEANHEVWIANFVTAATILSVIIYLAKRFINDYDKRLAAAEKKAEEIEENYIRRFEEVNERLEDKTYEIKKHFDEKVEMINRDRSSYREQQARVNGVLETKMDFIIKKIN